MVEHGAVEVELAVSSLSTRARSRGRSRASSQGPAAPAAARSGPALLPRPPRAPPSCRLAHRRCAWGRTPQWPRRPSAPLPARADCFRPIVRADASKCRPIDSIVSPGFATTVTRSKPFSRRAPRRTRPFPLSAPERRPRDATTTREIGAREHVGLQRHALLQPGAWIQAVPAPQVVLRHVHRARNRPERFADDHSVEDALAIADTEDPSAGTTTVGL